MGVVATVDHCCHLYRTNSGWLHGSKYHHCKLSLTESEEVVIQQQLYINHCSLVS